MRKGLFSLCTNKSDLYKKHATEHKRSEKCSLVSPTMASSFIQSVNKEEKFKTAVVEVDKISELAAKEAFGITVNPFGVNLVLQLPRKAND